MEVLVVLHLLLVFRPSLFRSPSVPFCLPNCGFAFHRGAAHVCSPARFTLTFSPQWKDEQTAIQPDMVHSECIDL